jgi:hypothetical protein
LIFKRDIIDKIRVWKSFLCILPEIYFTLFDYFFVANLIDDIWIKEFLTIP